MADNVVQILVESENRTKEGFDSAKADAETAGDDAGQGFLAGFAARIMGGSDGNGGIGGMLVKAFGSEGGINPGNFASLATGMLVIAPAIAAILVELTGVVNGLLAAGAGIGAFGLLALPTLKGIENAYTAVGTAQAKVTTAQTAYNDALEKQKLDPTKANATAAATALLNLQVAQEDLTKTTPKYQSIITGIQGLMTEFKQFSQPLQPVVLSLVNDALNMAAALLPYVAQLADAAAKPLEEVMGALSKSINSQGFQQFIDKLSKISGPAIEAIGAGFIKVAGALGHLMTVMSAHDVVHALNVAFDILAGTINGFADWVHGAQLNWDNFSGHMQQIAHTITANFQAMMAWFEGIPGSFETLGHQIESVWDGVVSWFKSVVSDIEHAFDGLPGFLKSAGEAAINGLIAGLKSVPVLGTVIDIAGEIADHFPHSPAKKGPLSGAGDPTLAGRRISEMLAAGMLSGAGTVGSAAGRLAGSIGGAPGGGSGGGGGGGQLVVTGAGAPQFLTLVKAIWPDLQLEVRTRGGGGTNSAQIAFGGAH